MDGAIFLQQVVNGMSLGGMYALIAIGYTMVYGVLRLINFAHADVMMVGAFTTLFLFSSIGLPWVMNKDNMLLYASICFLIFKRDKSIGFVLLGLWLVMNIGLVMSLLGSLSGYLLPLTLLIIGIVLFWFAKR